MAKRISYIDNTRAILIALVVLVHILNYANPKYDIVPYVLVQQFLDSFHMPAFFILSGMLTDGDKWRGRSVGSYFLHKAKTLLVPYLFFECVAILYKHFVLRSVSIAEGRRFALHCTSVYAGRTCSDIDLPQCTRLCVYAGGQSAE